MLFQEVFELPDFPEVKKNDGCATLAQFLIVRANEFIELVHCKLRIPVTVVRLNAIFFAIDGPILEVESLFGVVHNVVGGLIGLPLLFRLDVLDTCGGVCLDGFVMRVHSTLA